MDKTRFLAFMKEKSSYFAFLIKRTKEELQNFPFKKYLSAIKKAYKFFSLKKLTRLVKKISKKLSDSWKFVLSGCFCFLFFYYIVGSFWVENINITDTYNLSKDKNEKLETVNSMAFLINREIDGKMWTPNLPFAFPAYILDNMPNFQIGIISAVRDTVSTLKHFEKQTPYQKEHIKKADEFLHYPPNVWLMSRKGTFGLAPSSNAQYRKSRRELIKYNKENSEIMPADFYIYLKHLAKSLRLIIHKNDSQIIEHSSQFLDTKADDVFYKTRGYAFGAWQIALAAGTDFKSLIVSADIYTEWTYLLSSLQKVAEFYPLMVRNGQLNSVFGVNHLVVQNYYLERALVAITQIQNKLKENNAHQN